MLMFHDEGIWFEEEDPTSEYYRPECCKNVYLDHAKGKFDKNAKKYTWYKMQKNSQWSRTLHGSGFHEEAPPPCTTLI